jgi:SHS2 domain-containing protein
MRSPPRNGIPLYREIEHTADVGIVVEAETAAALFEKAALATASLMVAPAGVEPRDARTVALEADGWTDLLHRWLSEVVALFATQGFVAVEAIVDAVEPTRVQGVLRGEKFDPLRHEFYSEIKAVTYHDLAITGGDAGWCARVIFDV